MFGQLQLEDEGDVVWQTYKFLLNVSPGIAADEQIEGAYPSILQNLDQRLTRIEEYGVPNSEKGEQGPAGEQGPQGETGPQGPAGDKGKDGKDGKDGTSVRILGRFEGADELPDDAQIGDGYMIGPDLWSFSGSQWVNVGSIKGPQGETGPQGPTGEQGIQGEAGPQGPVGEQGIQGETGPQGPAGEQGIQGETGPQGPAGEQGIQGEVGPQGPAGEQGIQGEAGPQGPAGEQGIQGETGPRGPAGEVGPQGIPGDVNCYTRAESDVRYMLEANCAAVDFTIPASGWIQSHAYAGFAFEAEVAAEGISENDLVRADFDMRSWILAYAAEVAPVGDTSNGGIKFYAKSFPDGQLSGKYTVSRGIS